MKTPIIGATLMLVASAQAADPLVHEQDAYGNTRYDRPSYSVRDDGRLMETDPHGQKQHHKDQFQWKGDRLYVMDPVSGIRYDKPHYRLEKNGRLIETDPYGVRNHDRQWQLKDGKLYAVDPSGAIRHDKPRFAAQPGVRIRQEKSRLVVKP